MKSINILTYNILFLFILSPLLSYIFNDFLGNRTITFYYRILFWVYGFIYIFLAFINHKKLKLTKATYYIIAYAVFLVAYSLFNGELERRGIVNIIINNVNLTTAFTIIIINNTTFTDKFIKKMVEIIKITIIVTAIVSLIQVVKPSFMAATFYKDVNLVKQSIYSIRRASIFGYWPNAFGLSYIPLLSLFVGAHIYFRKRFLSLFLLFGGVSSFLTNTRYIMIAFVLLTLQVLFDNKKKMRKVFKYIIIASILLFFIYQVLSFFGYNIADWYYTRLFAEGSIEETTRYKAIENFLIVFPEHRWFGTGVGMTDEIKALSNAVGSSQIHVGYLAHLVYWGLVGSFLLFGFWFQVILRFYRNAKKTAYWGSFFAFLTFLWANVTLVHFSIFNYGLIFAFVFDKYFMDKYNNRLKNE